MSNSVAFDFVEGCGNRKMHSMKNRVGANSTIGLKHSRIQELERALPNDKRINKVLSVKMASEQIKIRKLTEQVEGYKAEMFKAMSQSVGSQNKLRRLQKEFEIKYNFLKREQGQNCLKTIAGDDNK